MVQFEFYINRVIVLIFYWKLITPFYTIVENFKLPIHFANK